MANQIAIAQLSSLGKIPSEDTVRLELRTDKEDTNKVLHLVFLAKYLNNRYRDSSIQLANEALELAEKLSWQKGIAYAHAAIAWSFYVHGNYVKALEHNNITLRIGEQLNELKIIGIAYSNIGQINYTLGNLNKSIEYNLKALQIDSLLKDEWGMARNIGILGSEYAELKHYNKALKYYDDAYKLTSKIGNKNGTAVWMSNTGDIYMTSKNYNKALYYFNQSSKIFKEIKNNWSYSEDLISIGEIYTSLKKYELSYAYLNEAHSICHKISTPENYTNCLLALSTLYENSDILLPDSLGKPILSSEKMKLQALQYLKKYIKLKDSLFSNEQKNKIQNLEVNYKLDSINRIQEKKDILTIQQIQRQKIIRNSFISGSILLVLLIVILINRNKLKQKIALERMRNRLSRDLHDDIGSTLSSIQILSRTAKMSLTKSQEEKTITALEKISERSGRLLDNMRDIIWNINPEYDSLDILMSRMREYASVILEAKNIDYEFHFPTEKIDYNLSMEVKNNIYLIFKEGVNNLVKYSEARLATFSIQIKAGAFNLIIQDDGIGFDQDELTHIGGLQNMQDRSAEINGSLHIVSTKLKGTRIELVFPFT